MTWQLASLIVLGAALAAGFTWYERTYPTSRMLALVATLAALAAIGRVAFAALPNVKPTTDIVLLSGFALGGAPGFVVGAVAALASNLVFGQGPWTPWQMVAWGLCGLIGAGLGRMTGRRMGRVPLALACGGAGLAFGAIMDASVWVTYGGQPTPGQYLAISATSLPFNLAHAIGNVVFCLAFGPALVRALLRFRARMEVRWADAPAAVAGVPAAPIAAVALALLLAAPLVAAQPAHAAAAGALPAARYLARVQNADGGWGAAPRAASNATQTSWTVIGLGAAGYDALSVRRNGHSPGPLLRRYAARSRAIADLERTALALGAAGIPGSTGGLAGRARGARHPGSPAVRTATAVSTSPAAAARAAPTTPPRRSRRSPPADIAPGAPSRAPRPGWPATRTATAATACSRRRPRTPSRPRTPCRALSPRGAARTASAATGRAPRSPTCARCRRRTAACATRAPARRRPSG